MHNKIIYMLPEGFTKILLFSLLLAFTATSCSTVKVVPDGSFRLKENKVVIVNKDKYPKYQASDIHSYIRQKPNTYFIGTWNPFLYVYNWSNGKDNGWDRFVKKLGQAPVIFDPYQIDKSISNMETHLKYLGYYNSTIVDSVYAEKKKATVIYEVTLGKQYPIKEITYIIRDTALNNIYLPDTVNSIIKRNIPLSEKVLEAESERASAIFRDDGYYGFSKNYFFFKADTISVKDSALLEVRIEDYTRNELEKDAKPHRRFSIGKVTIYPVSDVIRYRASLGNKGIQLLDTLKYNDIYILYDKKLKMRPSVLYNMNRMIPGSLYRESIVNNTYQRLSNLRIYNSVNVSIDQVSSDTVDCNIKLIPSKVQGYKLNLEASTNSTGLIGISPVVSYYNRNIFRGGEWLSLSLMGNFQFAVKDTIRSTEFGASIGLSFPTFVFIPDRIFNKIVPRTDLNFAYNYQKRPEYTRNMITAQFGYSWNSLNKNFYFQLYPLRFNIVKMSNMSPSFYEKIKNPFVKDSYKDHFDFGGSYTISYLTDPTINSKKSNFKANLQFDIAGNLISAFNKVMPSDSTGSRTIWGSPYSQYVRGELSLVYTFVFGKNKKSALAFRALGGAGFAYGNSSSMPFERLFWAGGPNSLRGWQARSIGPGTSPIDTTFTIPNQNGDMRFEANMELRFPIVWLLRGALFFDAGNVWLKHELSPSNNFVKGIALNTGVGLRLDIQFVVIRFDLGIKLHDPVTSTWHSADLWFKKGGYAFQFGIGYPF